VFTVEPGRGAHCTALIGTLTRTDVAQLRHTLDALLPPAGPVILDVTRLSTQFPPAVEELSRSLLAAGGWPTARLVVAGPDPRFRAALRTSAVLTITLGPEGLRIALRDFAASPVPVGVARLASSWGVTPRSDGKAVWAVLPRAS
jgi:hypothetical protein